MNKTCIISATIFLIIFSCVKKNEEQEKIVYSFESVVDSSFFCSFNHNSLYFKLYNTNPTNCFYVHTKDSIIIGFKYHFTIPNQPGLTIAISKSFDPKGFRHAFEGNFNGIISNKEYLSIFQKGKITYTYFTKKLGYEPCDSTSGASIFYDDWSTIYASKHMATDSLTNFYSNCNFNIASIQVLDSSNIVLEGHFNVKLHKQYGNDYQWFTNGYFKCYGKNLMSRF